MRVGFATTVAGWRHTHQPGIELVLHIAFENAVFNQNVILTRGTFVINGDGAATVGNGAIIHYGAQL